MFKDSFKYYKSRDPPPDLKDLIDFNKPDSSKVKIISPNVIEGEQTTLGLKSTKDWKIYEIIAKPGQLSILSAKVQKMLQLVVDLIFWRSLLKPYLLLGLIFIENPFTTLGQRYWITRCVKDYSAKPSKTNLDPHNVLSELENWWDVCSNDSERADALLPKMRWATLGYHHNWDTKKYSENARDKMPEDMAFLTEYFAKILGLTNFRAQAAIVNYYRMNSTLSGHTDHSEIYSEAPLFSVSFGQTAIFLIGGLLREDSADALLLRSGDVVVMSKGSRLRYHGIPRILAADSTSWDEEKSVDIQEVKRKRTDWDQIKSYISQSRVNMNIRQVLKPGQRSLDENIV